VILYQLLLGRWQMAANAHRQRRSLLRTLALIGLGAAFAGGVWWASNWFFGQCLAIEPIGQLVVRRALAMTLLTVFSLLSFSALIAAFSSLYLAEDLQLLVASPIPGDTLFTARFVEIGLAAAWMIAPFSLPIFLSAGHQLGADGGYYLKLLPVYGALTLIPTAIGISLSLLLTTVLSARRARNLFLIAGSMVLGGLLFVIRRLKPEQLMHPDEQAPLIQALQALQGLDPRWLPSSWALDALWPHLGYGMYGGGHPVALLVATSAASFFATGWLFRGLHASAFSRAQEGLSRAGRSGRSRGNRPFEPLKRHPAMMSQSLSLASELGSKDRRVFLRDTAQWSQLLILAAIIAIYLLNFSYIQAVTGTGLVSEIGLHFLNLAIGGFVTIALAARFVYPAVSLEGPAFWLIASSPNSMLSFLEAKSRSWTIRLVVFANLLLISTLLLLGADPLLGVSSILTITPLATGVGWLGIGLGARHPRFDADSAAAIATGLGGDQYMLCAAAVLVVQVVVSIVPTVLLVRVVRRGHVPDLTTSAIAFAAILITIGMPLLVGRLALTVGARHLEKGV
jgi:ABC-2 type transport system permease protein